MLLFLYGEDFSYRSMLGILFQMDAPDIHILVAAYTKVMFPFASSDAIILRWSVLFCAYAMVPLLSIQVFLFSILKLIICG